MSEAEEIMILKQQLEVLRQEYMAIENQASQKRQEILAVETRMAELACPFQVGQVVEVSPAGYKGGRYRIEAIKSGGWKGWTLETRRVLKGGGLGKQMVELSSSNKPEVVEDQ